MKRFSMVLLVLAAKNVPYLKKSIIRSIVILAVALLAQQVTRAQGTITYLSNLGLPSAGSEMVASDSWQATLFVTGNNAGGYLVDSVQLAMANATGTPSGFEATICVVNPNDPAGAEPGNSLGAFNGSLNPSTAGDYTYTPVSDVTLSPDTDYFIVLTAGTGLVTGAYEWSQTGTYSYNPTGGWESVGNIVSSGNGSSWTPVPDTDAQFAISATAIPEPSLCSLLLLGGGLIIYVRKQKRHWNLCEIKRH